MIKPVIAAQMLPAFAAAAAAVEENPELDFTSARSGAQHALAGVPPQGVQVLLQDEKTTWALKEGSPFAVREDGAWALVVEATRRRTFEDRGRAAQFNYRCSGCRLGMYGTREADGHHCVKVGDRVEGVWVLETHVSENSAPDQATLEPSKAVWHPGS